MKKYANSTATVKNSKNDTDKLSNITARTDKLTKNDSVNSADKTTDSLTDKIDYLTSKIEHLESLVLALVKGNLDFKSTDKNTDTFTANSIDKSDTSFACFSSLEDSNTTKELIVIKDSKKENKKEKKATATFQNDSDRLTYEHFRDSYPKTSHKSKEETCQKHWKKLSDKQKQEALDKVEIIQRKYAFTEAKYIPKLSNFLKDKIWEQIDEDSIALASKTNIRNFKKFDDNDLFEMFKDQAGVY